jgi:hypothetical protein
LGLIYFTFVYFRYEAAAYASAFALIRRDLYIDLKDLRHSMLDQAIDEAEKVVADTMWRHPLNPPPITPASASLYFLFHSLPCNPHYYHHCYLYYFVVHSMHLLLAHLVTV